MFHHDLVHTGVANSSAPTTNNVLWSSPTGFWIEASPAVSKGRVYIGSEDGKVYCFNASTGATLWTFQTYDAIVCSPAVYEGKVYIGSSNHNVYCLDAETGAQIWYYPTYWCILQSSPAIDHGKVFIGSHDDKMYCFDAKNGSKLWEYLTLYFISSSPAVADNKVYFGCQDGSVYCLDEDTGAETWESVIGYTILMSSPTISGPRLYIGALDFELHCLSTSTGAELWNFLTGDWVTGTAAVANGKVYIGSWDNNVYCLNATYGTLIWTYQTDGPVDSSPVIADGKLYVGSSDNAMYCLNAETGEKIWKYVTGGQILSSPAVADGNVYVGSLDNNVYCFGGENQPPVASFTWTPSTPSAGQVVSFDASTSYDPDGTIDLYEWDWNNDGVFDESSKNPMTVHMWSNPGSYPVTLRVTDGSIAVNSLTKTVVIIHENQPPNLPTIQGESSGKVGKTYLYSFETTDPEEDDVSYFINWSDGTPETCIGPFASGAEATATHTWTDKGTYIIKAKARDIHGNESDWATLSVTMPFSYNLFVTHFWEKFLEKCPGAFPLLRFLLG